MQLTSSGTLLGVNRKPFFSSLIYSGRQPMFEPMTGHPQDKASTPTSPKLSCNWVGKLNNLRVCNNRSSPGELKDQYIYKNRLSVDC